MSAAGSPPTTKHDPPRMEKVGDGECGFVAIAADGRDGDDEIAKRELRAI